MIIQSKVSIKDDGYTKTSCRVDASACNKDAGQLNQENYKSNWKKSQNLEHKKERDL